MFEKGVFYKCKHDVIKDSKLAFNRNGIYYCIDDNILQGLHDYIYDMREFLLPQGEYYYFEKYEEPEEEEIINDNVNHPPHYTWLKDKCGIEVIDITRHMDFCLGNAIKYILRAGHKHSTSLSDNQKEIEDLKKAIFYINDKITQIESR